jgi:hypothetical protein
MICAENSMSMNLRHAAALALVGWYLMMPPEVRDKKGDPVSVEAISHWDTLAVFDSAMNCYKAQNHVLDRAREELTQRYHATGTSSVSLVKSAMDRATTPKELDEIGIILSTLQTSCIASDDPRLKPN